MNITKIGNNTFSYCQKLATIILPTSITEIGSSAFYGCTALTSINIPKGVTYIVSNTFSGCTTLTSINIPENVTYIGSGAFENCTELTSINIPKSVTEIEEAAFSGCTGLTSIYTYGITPANIYSDTFKGIDKKSCTLYVPTSSHQDYWLAAYWGDFENIVEFDPATGINHTTTQPEATEISRYTLDGQKLDTPARGMNIVKYNDGTVKMPNDASWLLFYCLTVSCHFKVCRLYKTYFVENMQHRQSILYLFMVKTY